MKLFVSTREGQGLRDNDFNFCNDEELLVYCSKCDRDNKFPYGDGFCGCYRCMVGIDTMQGTTTFTVINYSISFEDFVSKITNYYKKILSKEDIDDSKYLEYCKYIIEDASKFEIGEILERRGINGIQIRKNK